MTITAPSTTEAPASAAQTGEGHDAAVEVRPVAGLIGAEIGGVDLSAPLDAGTVAAIRAALLRHKVVFFRDQQLGPDEQVAFGRYFGEVTPAHPTLPSLEGHPEVLVIGGELYGEEAADATDWTFAVENNWHTDVTFVANPPLGSILRAVEVPPYGGDTGWTNLVAAYEGLSEPIRELVDGLSAVHRNEIHLELGGQRGTGLRNAFTSQSYATVHPVVRVHPETGERALFVNPNFTSHLLGLRNAESRALLGFLYDHIANPRFTVRLHWEPGTVAFWDNRATAHLAAFDVLPGATRVLHRITLAGDLPVGVNGRPSEAIEGGEFG